MKFKDRQKEFELNYTRGRYRHLEDYHICQICKTVYYLSSIHRSNNKYCSTKCNGIAKTIPINWSGNDFAAFMGMYLAEGYTRRVVIKMIILL